MIIRFLKSAISPHMYYIGLFYVIISSLIVFAQDASQLYTKIKLKSPVSLSLLLILFQAPEGAFDSCFMIFGNKDNWSLRSPMLIGIIQQFILLSIALFYKIRNYQSVNNDHSDILNQN